MDWHLVELLLQQLLALYHLLCLLQQAPHLQARIAIRQNYVLEF